MFFSCQAAASFAAISSCVRLQLLARGHIFQRVSPGRHFVVADDQGIARRQFVGQFHGAFQLAFGEFHRDVRRARKSRAMMAA